jgi:hypothetical protein
MTTATDMYDRYLQAEQAVLEGKTVKFGERLLGMEDLSEIRAGRKEWERKVSAEAAGAAAPRFGGLSYSVARMD